MDLRAGFGDGRKERPQRLAEVRAPASAPAFPRQRNERVSPGRWADPWGEPRQHPVTMERLLRDHQGFH